MLRFVKVLRALVPVKYLKLPTSFCAHAGTVLPSVSVPCEPSPRGRGQGRSSRGRMRVDSVFRLLLVLSFFLVTLSIAFLFPYMLNVLVCVPLHFPVSVYV